MPVLASDFTTGGRFPEFSGAPEALVLRCIAEAESRTPSVVWGEKRDQGVGLLAAHLLAMSPNAKDMRLKGDPSMSIYLAERKRIARTVVSGWRVTGENDYP